MINIAKLLKNCPEGTKLYSPLFGEVKFLSVDSADSTIIVETERETHEWFSPTGEYKVNKSHMLYSDAECLLFPSKDCRTWEGWKLPIESKFNVGDWIANDYCAGKVIALTDDAYLLDSGQGIPFSCEHNAHLWTIEDAKVGDILVNDAGYIFINAGFESDDKVTLTCYCYVSVQGIFYEEKHKIGSWLYVSDVHPATKEQRDLLFTKMKEAKYKWNADKKELRKIQHYDISNFKPKQWVLVRDDDEWEWALTRFSYLSNGSASLFVCINGASFQQCIPFEDNEKLLGTTDMCDEQYINW